MIFKSIFDYSLAFVLTILLFPLITLIVVLASLDTKAIGVFSHKRIGKHAKPFLLYKVRTMKGNQDSSITVQSNPAITKFGRFLRKYKLDELPQLFNILFGQMSFVGPRPDVEGYADQLKSEDRIILSVKPGIFGPAQLKYNNESELLAKQENPVQYNNEVIWPDKVKINKAYTKNRDLLNDLKIIYKTLKLVFIK